MIVFHFSAERWCLDPVSMPGVLQFMVFWGLDVVSFGTQSFGMLVACTLAHGGPSSDPEGLRRLRSETLRSRLGFLLIFCGLWDRSLKVDGHRWSKKCVFVYACFQATLFVDFGV